MPKYRIHVSMSALHVWSLTDTFEAATEEEAHKQAEGYIRGLTDFELKQYDDGHDDYNTQVEDCQEVKPRFVPDELICKALDKGMSVEEIKLFPKMIFDEKIKEIGKYLSKEEIAEVLA